MSYKDGSPCGKCGTSEWNKWGRCKQCQYERGKRWQEDNPEKARESSRNWKRNNPKKHSENTLRYQKRYPEKVNEKNLRWQRDNPDKVRERSRNYRLNNPEKVRETNRRWGRNNPDKIRAKGNRRRTRKTQAGGSYTAAEFKALCKQYNYRCLCCGKKTKLTADHIIPVIAGGTSDISNIQPLCKSCNSIKGIETTDYRTGPGILRWIQRKLFD